MHKYTKEQRQGLLREIIGQQGIGGQHYLQTELDRRGVDVTQATISRDLQEMGYIKSRTESGAYRYELYDKPSEGALRKRLKIMFRDFVTDVRSSQNLVLVRTSPGNANGVASLIDGLRNPAILGTVAGDDTILVVVETNAHRREVERGFRELMK
jgi:transcriptional regulator of arginine metabolism